MDVEAAPEVEAGVVPLAAKVAGMGPLMSESSVDPSVVVAW